MGCSPPATPAFGRLMYEIRASGSSLASQKFRASLGYMTPSLKNTQKIFVQNPELGEASIPTEGWPQDQETHPVTPSCSCSWWTMVLMTGALQ